MSSIKDLCTAWLHSLAGNRIYLKFFRPVGRAGLLPNWLWLRLPCELTFRVSLPDGASFRYASIAADAIGRFLFWRGIESYEFETLRVFYRMAQKSRLIVDIGANTGIFSLVACLANPHCRIVAFEPVPRVRERLATNLRINGWQERCEIREEAVGKETGAGKLHVITGECPSSSSFRLEGFRGTRGTVVEVPLTTLDAVCSPGQKVDLVKIDVEGFEDQVLQGMTRIINESAPAIIIECCPDGPYRAINRFLAGFGYRFFHLLEEGPVPRERIAPDPEEKYRNFLCVREENSEGGDPWSGKL